MVACTALFCTMLLSQLGLISSAARAEYPSGTTPHCSAQGHMRPAVASPTPLQRPLHPSGSTTVCSSSCSAHPVWSRDAPPRSVPPVTPAPPLTAARPQRQHHSGPRQHPSGPWHHPAAHMPCLPLRGQGQGVELSLRPAVPCLQVLRPHSSSHSRWVVMTALSLFL